MSEKLLCIRVNQITMPEDEDYSNGNVNVKIDLTPNYEGDTYNFTGNHYLRATYAPELYFAYTDKNILTLSITVTKATNKNYIIAKLNIPMKWFKENLLTQEHFEMMNSPGHKHKPIVFVDIHPCADAEREFLAPLGVLCKPPNETLLQYQDFSNDIFENVHYQQNQDPEVLYVIEPNGMGDLSPIAMSSLEPYQGQDDAFNLPEEPPSLLDEMLGDDDDDFLEPTPSKVSLSIDSVDDSDLFMPSSNKEKGDFSSPLDPTSTEPQNDSPLTQGFGDDYNSNLTSSYMTSLSSSKESLLEEPERPAPVPSTPVYAPRRSNIAMITRQGSMDNIDAKLLSYISQQENTSTSFRSPLSGFPEENKTTLLLPPPVPSQIIEKPPPEPEDSKRLQVSKSLGFFQPMKKAGSLQLASSIGAAPAPVRGSPFATTSAAMGNNAKPFGKQSESFTAPQSLFHTTQPKSLNTNRAPLFTVSPPQKPNLASKSKDTLFLNNAPLVQQKPLPTSASHAPKEKDSKPFWSYQPKNKSSKDKPQSGSPSPQQSPLIWDQPSNNSNLFPDDNRKKPLAQPMYFDFTK